MRVQSDAALFDVLLRTKKVAVLGVSDKPQRPSHKVFSFWRARGVDAIPVNPQLAGHTILDCRVIPNLAALDEAVDMVDVFRASANLPDIVDEAAAIGAPVLWTQLGVTHAEAEEKALSMGMSLVVDRCPAIEIPRLEALGYKF